MPQNLFFVVDFFFLLVTWKKKNISDQKKKTVAPMWKRIKMQTDANIYLFFAYERFDFWTEGTLLNLDSWIYERLKYCSQIII